MSVQLGFVVYFFICLFGIIVFFGLIVYFFGKRRTQYGVKSVTQRGEEVRSNAERRIADYFAGNNINYVYEKKTKTRGGFSGYTFGHPDFYLPDYDVYVEYWGLVNADDRWTRERYVRNMKRKMAIYHKNNIKFISIYPDNLENLDWIFRKKFKEVTGLEMPRQD